VAASSWLDWRKAARFLWSIWALGLGVGLLLFFSALVLAFSILGLGENFLAHVGRLWARLTVWLCGVPPKVHGQQNLAPGEHYVFACNHSSSVDIPVLQAILPTNFRWIAKIELFRFPIFGPAMRAVGYIPINRSSSREAIRSLQEAAARIAGGASVVIFPEGTRTSDGEVLPFKSGAFTLAIKSGRPVIPVYIHRSFEAMRPKSYVVSPGPVHVYFGAPLATDGLKTGDRDELAEKVRQAVIELQAQARAEHPLPAGAWFVVG